jgi:hypothetical protein
MPLTKAQQELYEVMSQTSESAYSAGWMAGTEYRLWGFTTDPEDDGKWGRIALPASLRTQLATLSRRVNGWIFYAAGDQFPRDLWGERFVSMGDWIVMYEAEVARRAPFLEIAKKLPRRYLSYPEAFELIRRHKR